MIIQGMSKLFIMKLKQIMKPKQMKGKSRAKVN